MGSGTRRRWLTAAGGAARRGLHEPIIGILLLAGAFTVIAGSPVHGALLLAVATGLAWDTARGQDRAGEAPGPAAELAGLAPEAPAPSRGRRVLAAVMLVAGAAVYAIVVGSFTRYTWPATVALASLAALVMAIGWRGPLRELRDPGPLPARGVALWNGLMVAAGVWELVAYFQQPSLTAISYEHPTISALTDPVLASHAGRSAVLAIWLALGWFLVDR
jgi:hypothetical protein